MQRDKFLPTIDLINQHTQVIEIGGELDYRLKGLAQTKLYHYPLNDEAEKSLLDYFMHLAPLDGIAHKVLTITDRNLPTRYCAENVVWFSFDDLCDTARSTIDYIEIAHCFKTVLISGVKVMGTSKEDVALRFIALVDEFYERHVTLILCAEVPLNELYQGQRHVFEFHITFSRLTEMQTPHYLAKPHLL